MLENKKDIHEDILDDDIDIKVESKKFWRENFTDAIFAGRFTVWKILHFSVTQIFYVKSLLEDLKVQKMPFLQF